MREVTQEEFFARMNTGNVHPRVDAASLKGRYHASDWVDQNTHLIVGRSISDSHGSGISQYFLPQTDAG